MRKVGNPWNKGSLFISIIRNYSVIFLWYGRIALQRKEIMSQNQFVAGGES